MFRVTQFSGLKSSAVPTFEEATKVALAYAAEGDLPSTIEGLGSRWIVWVNAEPELREGPGFKMEIADPVAAKLEAMRQMALELCTELRHNDDVPMEAIHAVRRVQYAAEDAVSVWTER